MKTVYCNAHIDGRNETALLVEDDLIVSFGNEELKEEADEIVDCEGRTIYPGMIDSHMHLLELGRYLSTVRLEDVKNLSGLKEKVTEGLKDLKEGKWLIGRGWNEELMEEHAMPDKALLDSISTDHPIALTRACGHIMAVNSRALEIAGIREDMELEDGYIHFDTGIVEENGIRLIEKEEKNDDETELVRWIEAGMKYCNAHGITSVGSDDFISVTQDWQKVLNVFERMSFQKALTVRVNEQCEFPDIEAFSKFLDDGYTMFTGNELFMIGPLKLITDGSLGARTAAMQRPYHDDPETSGYMTMDEDSIRLYTELAARFNMGVICHCIGDEALETVLRVFEEEVLEGNPLHHGIVHCQIMHKGQTERVIRKRLCAYFQSLFIDTDASFVKERAGALLAKTSYPYKTLLEGTLACNGSDAPVELPDPFKGMELSVTRTSLKTGDSMNPSESLTVRQALDSYTINGARVMFSDEYTGSLEEGKKADFCIVSRNIEECDVKKIHETEVWMTVMDGKKVYQA